MSTDLLFRILGSIRGNAAAVSKRILTLGFGVKNKVLDTVFPALEKLGFKTPRTRKAKIKELKKIQKEVKEEIEVLEEQEQNNAAQEEQGPVLLKEQNGASKYLIENKAGIKIMFKLRVY